MYYCFFAKCSLLHCTEQAQINSRFSTPLPATIVTGLFAGLIALLFNIEILSKLVSVGTLFVLGLVSLAVLVRRYHQRDAGASAWPLTIRILMLVIFAVLEGLSFSNEWHTASFVFIGEIGCPQSQLIYGNSLLLCC